MFNQFEYDENIELIFLAGFIFFVGYIWSRLSLLSGLLLPIHQPWSYPSFRWCLGPLALGLVGLVIWMVPGFENKKLVASGVFCLIMVFDTAAMIGSREWRHARFETGEKEILWIVAIVSLIAIGKTILPHAPPGALYELTISRTLEVGDRPDSRIPYHAVQVILNDLKGVDREALYLPYAFSSRGPLLGMIAAPFVALVANSVPQQHPNQAFKVFDPYGFMAFRVIAISLAALVFLLVADCACFFGSKSAGVISASLLSLSPFVIHEHYFTWPKLVASSYVLMGLLLICYRKLFFSGLVLGLAYLFHPIGLVGSTVVGFWHSLRLWQNKDGYFLRDLFRQGTIIFLGLGCVMALWFATFPDQLDTQITLEFKQSKGFLHNWMSANIRGAVYWDFPHWVVHRADSFLNTVVPLYMPFVNRDHPAVNTIYAPLSSGIVNFYFQYWTTWPFAMGIVLYLTTLIGFVRTVADYRNEVIALVLLPAMIFWVFWGGASTGLMREGLHFTFLIFFVFLGLMLEKRPENFSLFRFIVLSSYGRFLIALEIYGVLLLPTYYESGVKFSSLQLNDIVGLSLIFFGVIVLVNTSRRHLSNQIGSTN